MPIPRLMPIPPHYQVEWASCPPANNHETGKMPVPRLMPIPPHYKNVSHLPISLSPYLPISPSPHLPTLFPVPCSL
ncbi:MULTISPECIES: hypothetical protein [unclassified Moorena]|uniref:hypothetical protein n=1 Tax=unclassified Moorena TaxID=2683338 RepID=UPI0013FE8A58|nr:MULTISPECIES: hypothetical protein [unclassified Moorena]NEO14430.1 hypothetical protein [Moorena sp. SIO3E8]NEQ00842.1 hypothetical protein [Moorena sp. SIO3F7]